MKYVFACLVQMRLYGQVLFDRMHDVTTLIPGPSGTGKELVAAAIGLSRFIPFDIRQVNRSHQPEPGD